MGGTGMKWRRIVVKLSGEALRGKRAMGSTPRRWRPSPPISRRGAARGRNGGRRRRRQFLPRHRRRGKGHRAGRARFDRHAGDGHECARSSNMRSRSRARRRGRSRPCRCRRSANPIRARRRCIISARAGSSFWPAAPAIPFFTTDTGAALRAAELSCDVILKATQVDGVYSADPKRDPDARRYDRLTHDEAIAQKSGGHGYRRFRAGARKRIPIMVFSIKEPGAICAALAGQGQGDARHAPSRRACRSGRLARHSAAGEIAQQSVQCCGHIRPHIARMRANAGEARVCRRAKDPSLAGRGTADRNLSGIRVLRMSEEFDISDLEAAHAGGDRLLEA